MQMSYFNNARITIKNQTIEANVKTWQSTCYLYGQMEYSGEIEFINENAKLILDSISPADTIGIYYSNRNYSAVVTSYSYNPNNIISTCNLTFLHGRLNHYSGSSMVYLMSIEEVKDWLGEIKFIQIKKKVNNLLSKSLKEISESLPLQNPAVDLCALFKKVRPLALFDPEFLSYQPESLILYQKCISHGYSTRFWKISDRHMAGIGEESALKAVEKVKHEVNTCVSHLPHLFHLTMTQREEFLNRHEPMGFNMTYQL